nr:trichohyalin-like [Procambarus clarkii]
MGVTMGRQLLLVCWVWCAVWWVGATPASSIPNRQELEQHQPYPTDTHGQSIVMRMIEEQMELAEEMREVIERVDNRTGILTALLLGRLNNLSLALSSQLQPRDPLTQELRRVSEGVEELARSWSTHLQQEEAALTRENVTLGFLKKINKLERENEALERDNALTVIEAQQLKEENRQVKTEILQVEEENRKVKQDVRQAEEEMREVQEERRIVEAEKRVVEKEKREIEQDNRNLRAEIRLMEQSLRGAQERNANLDQRNEEMKEENGRLKNRVLQLEGNYSRENCLSELDQEESRLLEERIKELEEEKKNLMTTNERLMNDNGSKEQEIRKLQEEMRTLTNMVTDNEGINNGIWLRGTTRVTDVKEQEKTDTVERNNTRMTEESIEKERELLEILEQMGALLEKVTEMESKNKRLEQNQTLLEEEIEKHKQEVTEERRDKMILRDKVIALEDKALALEFVNIKLTEENRAKSDHTFTAREESRFQVESLQQEKMQMEQNISRLEEERQANESQNRRLLEVKKQLEEKIMELEEENWRMELSSAQLVEANERNRQLLDEKLALEDKVGKLVQAERERWKNKIAVQNDEQGKEEREILTAKVIKLEKEKTQLEINKTILEEELQQLKEEKREVEEVSRMLETRVMLLEEEKWSLQENNTWLIMDKEQREHDKMQLKEEKNTFETKYQEMEKRKMKVEEDNLQLMEDKEKREQENNELQEENKALVAKVLELEEDKWQLEQGNTWLVEENEGLLVEKKRMEGEKRKLEEEKRTLEEGSRQVQLVHRQCQGNLTKILRRATDCAALYCLGSREDGVYTIYLPKDEEEHQSVSVWCDMTTDGGGWTVFLARQEQGAQENFARNWEDYKTGFGRASSEYWLGNEVIHSLTTEKPQSLRLDVKNYQGDQRWAQWETFSVASEHDQFGLEVTGYDNSSTLGDTLTGEHTLHNTKFSTIDKDNDGLVYGSCVDFFSGGGGWWYSYCSHLKPTAPLAAAGRSDTLMAAYWTPGVLTWVRLNWLQMKIRPRDFPACTS